jgi:hypothetical protein
VGGTTRYLDAHFDLKNLSHPENILIQSQKQEGFQKNRKFSETIGELSTLNSTGIFYADNSEEFTMGRF